jgi:hypothetical protein
MASYWRTESSQLSSTLLHSLHVIWLLSLAPQLQSQKWIVWKPRRSREVERKNRTYAKSSSSSDKGEQTWHLHTLGVIKKPIFGAVREFGPPITRGCDWTESACPEEHDDTEFVVSLSCGLGPVFCKSNGKILFTTSGHDSYSFRIEFNIAPSEEGNCIRPVTWFRNGFDNVFTQCTALCASGSIDLIEERIVRQLVLVSHIHVSQTQGILDKRKSLHRKPISTNRGFRHVPRFGKECLKIHN